MRSLEQLLASLQTGARLCPIALTVTEQKIQNRKSAFAESLLQVSTAPHLPNSAKQVNLQD